MTTDTPRTESFIEIELAEHARKKLDDLEHYMEMTGRLADHARQLERELSAQSSRERKLVEAARKVLRFIKQNHWRYGYAEGIWDMNSSGIMYDEVKAALEPYREDV